MPFLREQVGSPRFERDASGKSVGMREWHTDLSSVDAAEDAFETEGGRTFPETSGQLMQFDRVLLEPKPRNTGVRVTAYYSTFKVGRFQQQPNRDDPTYYHWLWGSIDRKYEIPYSIKRQTFYGQAGAEQIIDAWTQAKLIVKETHPTRTLKVRVNVANLGEFDTIAEQVDRIHELPGGGLWRFLGGDVQEGDGTYHDASYEWEYDRGTPLSFPQNPTPRVQFQIVQEDPALLRLPYTTTEPIDPFDVRVAPFGAIAILAFSFADPEGWRSLPGANRIG